MDAPQTLEEIAPIEAALRRLDGLLRLRWNPDAYVTAPGHYDVWGKPVAPKYEGRWEVIRLAADPPILVYQVREEGSSNYRPVGWWLVDFLEKWDRANTHWMDEQKALFDAEELQAHAADTDVQLEAEERMERFATDNLHMKKWIGRGFGQGATL